MKRIFLALIFIFSLSVMNVSCRENPESAGEQVEEAAEETGEAVEEGAEEVEEEVEEMGDGDDA
ncbi:hypothetical protein [Robertkochia aurantiaca]|uniref:hypothetical protein n=1 Tax=Robertkochia aurantiaca TaxID=2873700 RepID=UPI001CC973A0|nr:hypothetical protein [Robertkochia sp. 3YJGBD-33]